MKQSVVSMLALLLAISGCAVKVDHDVKGHVDPIEIKHYIALDTTKLEAYYRSECEKLYTDQTDIDKCTQEDLGKFLSQFTFQT